MVNQWIIVEFDISEPIFRLSSGNDGKNDCHAWMVKQKLLR